jgi:superoxide dismutase, Fe-Mn family
MSVSTVADQLSGPFELPELPYADDALAPYITANTINYHYGKHHKAYVTNLNKLTEGSDLASKSLEEIICSSVDKPEKAGLFNNAAQVWNHTFYWHSLATNGGGKPSGELGSLIDKSFGDYETFKKEFSAAAVSQFGSGWAWLLKDGESLKIAKTGNAGTPLTQNIKPLLTIDLWEHAYYLDYQNARPRYIETIIDSLLNWSFAADNL